MELTNDLTWTKVEILPDITYSHVVSLLDKARALHLNKALSNLTFENGEVTLNFEDGNIWKFKFVERNITTNVIYHLSSTQEWSQFFIRNFVTKVSDEVLSLHVNHQVDSIKMIPRS